MTDRPASATFTLGEPAEAPWPGLFFGHIAMVPFALGTPTLPLYAAGLLLGRLSLEILDPIAARKRQAPLSFARLRPARMAIPVLCLAATLVLLSLG